MNVELSILCFFIYAFLGYVCEVIYCSIGQKKLVNRGYLYLPICPIYGFGAILILSLMWPIREMWYLVFFLGIFLTTTLEYLTSYVMELFFHMRWWDYSKRKWNINGRVCLRNSLLFGGLVMLVVYGIQPILFSWINKMSVLSLRICNGVLLFFFLIDFIFSTIKNINIAKVVSKLVLLKEEATGKLSNMKEEATDKLLEWREEASLKLSETKEYLNHTAIVMKLKRFVKKYPNLSLRSIGKQHESVEELIEHYSKQEAGDTHEHH